MLNFHQHNYQFSSYIAELANTLSNIATVALAIHGCRMALAQSLPTRYLASFAVRVFKSLKYFASAFTYVIPHVRDSVSLALAASRSTPPSCTRRNLPMSFLCLLRSD